MRYALNISPSAVAVVGENCQTVNGMRTLRVNSHRQQTTFKQSMHKRQEQERGPIPRVDRNKAIYHCEFLIRSFCVFIAFLLVCCECVCALRMVLVVISVLAISRFPHLGRAEHSSVLFHLSGFCDHVAHLVYA